MQGLAMLQTKCDDRMIPWHTHTPFSHLFLIIHALGFNPFPRVSGGRYVVEKKEIEDFIVACRYTNSHMFHQGNYSIMQCTFERKNVELISHTGKWRVKNTNWYPFISITREQPDISLVIHPNRIMVISFLSGVRQEQDIYVRLIDSVTKQVRNKIKK